MARAFKSSEFKERKGPEGLSKIVDAKIVEGKEFGTVPDPDSGQPVQPKNLQLQLSTQNLETGDKATAFIKIASPKKGELEVTDFTVNENEHGVATIIVGEEAPWKNSPFAVFMASMEEADPSLPETMVPAGAEYDDDSIFACDVSVLVGLNADFYQDEQPAVVNRETGEAGKPYYRTKVRSFHTDEEVEEILKDAKKAKKGKISKTETAAPAKAAAKTTTSTASAAPKGKAKAKVVEPEPEPEAEAEEEETEEETEEGGDDENVEAMHAAIDEAITKAINKAPTKVLVFTKLANTITPFLREAGLDNDDLVTLGPLMTDAEVIDQISEREGCVWERAGMQIKIRAVSASKTAPAASATAAPAKKKFGAK